MLRRLACKGRPSMRTGVGRRTTLVGMPSGVGSRRSIFTFFHRFKEQLDAELKADDELNQAKVELVDGQRTLSERIQDAILDFRVWWELRVAVHLRERNIMRDWTQDRLRDWDNGVGQGANWWKRGPLDSPEIPPPPPPKPFAEMTRRELLEWTLSYGSIELRRDLGYLKQADARWGDWHRRRGFVHDAPVLPMVQWVAAQAVMAMGGVYTVQYATLDTFRGSPAMRELIRSQIRPGPPMRTTDIYVHATPPSLKKGSARHHPHLEPWVTEAMRTIEYKRLPGSISFDRDFHAGPPPTWDDELEWWIGNPYETPPPMLLNPLMRPFAGVTFPLLMAQWYEWRYGSAALVDGRLRHIKDTGEDNRTHLDKRRDEMAVAYLDEPVGEMEVNVEDEMYKGMREVDAVVSEDGAAAAGPVTDQDADTTAAETPTSGGDATKAAEGNEEQDGEAVDEEGEEGSGEAMEAPVRMKRVVVTRRDLIRMKLNMAYGEAVKPSPTAGTALATVEGEDEDVDTTLWSRLGERFSKTETGKAMADLRDRMEESENTVVRGLLDSAGALASGAKSVSHRMLGTGRDEMAAMNALHQRIPGFDLTTFIKHVGTTLPELMIAYEMQDDALLAQLVPNANHETFFSRINMQRKEIANREGHIHWPSQVDFSAAQTTEFGAYIGLSFKAEGEFPLMHEGKPVEGKTRMEAIHWSMVVEPHSNNSYSLIALEFASRGQLMF